MNFADLPTEIIAHIFLQLRPTYRETIETYACVEKAYALRAAARLNKKCYESAVPVLYSRINLNTRAMQGP